MAEANNYHDDGDEDEEYGAITEDIYDVPRNLIEEDDQIYANIPNTKPIPVVPPDPEPTPPPLPSKTKPRLPEKVGLTSVRSHSSSSTESSPDVFRQRPTPRPRLSLQHRAQSECKPTPKPRIKRQNRAGTLTLFGATVSESATDDHCEGNQGERSEPAGMANPTVSVMREPPRIPDDFESSVYEEFNPASPKRTEVDQSIYEPITEPCFEAPPLASFRPQSLNSSTEEKGEYEEAVNHVDAEKSSDQRVVIGAESDTDNSYQAVWNMASGRVKIPECSPGASPRDSSLSFCEPSFSPPPLPPGYQLGPPPPPPPRVSSYGRGLRDSMNDCSAFAEERDPLPTPPSASADPFAALDQRSSSVEANVYQPSRFSSFNPTSTSTPPPPPPKGRDPFEGLFDASLESCDLDEGITMGTSPTSPSWESDDTLSDGGEFLDSADFAPPSEELIRNLRAAIPIVPAVQSKMRSREGFLYKLSSKSKNRLGWHKRWVTFDSNVVKYFSHKTSCASKRVIPVTTMINVENDIKNADFLNLESHEYRFKLTTVDRVYTFSTDDRDDLLMWTSLLMHAIIDAKTDDYHEGGDMCNPDREGYVKMEGVKQKRYLVIKGENFCYYNTYNDFKACSPIHQIPMKLASIKDLGKFKLRIITPAVSYFLLLENQDEINGWKVAFEEAIASGLGEDNILNEVYDENHSNRFCADCGMPNPHWASVNLAITLCKNCAGIHRMLGLPLSKVRSLRMDQKVWTPSLIELMKLIGNDNSNNFWEWNSTEDNRIDSDSDMEQKKEFILSKYRQKSFYRHHPLATDLEALNEALCKCVQYNDVLESLQLLFSGADMLHCSKLDNKNPLQLARDAQQTLQVEFLVQNGAETLGEGKKSFNASQASFKKVNKYGIRGFLFKTGSNPKGDFLKRWVILENGCLSYYENDKSIVAKDQITRKEMLSVACTSDERYEHCFELGTAKNGSRTYLFAAESFAERQKWVINLAKSIAPVREATLLSIKDLDRGGIVFLRDGATKDWKGHWVHIKGKMLYIYQIEKDIFEEIDLRKVKSLSMLGGQYSPCPSAGFRRPSMPLFSLNSYTVLQTTDRCTDALDEGQPFVLDLLNRAIYIQGDTKKETSNWFTAFTKATTESGEYVGDQQLTSDDVPLIVDKCINFIELHGMDSEGIYRLSGQTSVVTKLLMLFKTDARNVHIKMEEFTVNDVASSLKRFLRSLRDPIMMESLHVKWIEALNRPDVTSRVQWYKYLLGDLSTVNFRTLKRMLAHLARIAQNESMNKMGLRNLSAIFGPVFMNAGKEDTMAGFGEADKEMQVVHDLIEEHRTLFELKEIDLEHERLIDDARRRIEQAMKDTTRQSTAPAGDMIIGIHVEKGDVVNYKVPCSMTAEELTNIIRDKAQLPCTEDSNWGLFEVISGGELERPLHFSEKVLEVVLQWGSWSEAISRNNFICIKRNYVYDKLKLVFDPLFSLFSELRYSDKNRKAWKKFYFEFSHYALHMRKDTKAAHPVCSWNAEDLSLYIGVQQRRSPPTKWGFTFITKDDRMNGTLVGHSVCCSNEEELFRWVAAILHAQQPLGLVPDGSLSPSRAELESQVPVGGGGGSPSRTSRVKHSFIHKLIKR